MIIHLMDFSPEYTGNFIYSLIELNRNNKNTLLIFPEEARSREWIDLLKNEGILVEFIDKSQSFIKRHKILKAIINKYNFKNLIINSHFHTFNVDSILLKKYYKCKLIWFGHSGTTVNENSIKLKCKNILKIKIIANRYVDCLICVSDYVKELNKGRGFKEDIIKVVLNGVYINKHNIDLDKKKQFRENYRVKENEKIILAFGYNVHIKGIDVLVKASQNIPTAKIAIVGRDEMKQYVTSTKEYKENKEKFILLNPIEEVSYYYNACDMFVSASRTEGFPYSIAEAMLYENIIVTSNIEAVQFYLQSGKGIKSFKSEDHAELALRVNEFFEMDKLQVDRASKKNRQFIIDNLGLEKWAGNINYIYNDML